MTEIVFEYPTEESAIDRARALAALRGAVVRVDRTCAAVIFEPADFTIAEELLAGSFCGSVAVSWDSSGVWNRSMTLGEGIGMVFWSWLVGGVVAFLRRIGTAGDLNPEPTPSLKL